LNFDEMMFQSQVLYIIECIFMYMTCKPLWDEFWAFERSKFGILGEKGLKPETFWQNWWAFA